MSLMTSKVLKQKQTELAVDCVENGYSNEHYGVESDKLRRQWREDLTKRFGTQFGKDIHDRIFYLVYDTHNEEVAEAKYREIVNLLVEVSK